MRLAALTAVAMMGTGCFVSNDRAVGDVNLFWNFLRHAPAANQLGSVLYDETLDAVNVNGICPQSGVDTVRVESDAGLIDIECTGPVGGGLYSQGIVISNLPAGTNSIRVTGYRGGTAVFRSTASVNVLANFTVDRVVSVEGLSADLDVFGYLFDRSTNQDYLTCGEAGSPNIGYSIRDGAGTLVEEGLTGCSNPLPSLTFSGFLDLDNYTVRLQGFTVPGGALVFDSCSVAFDHFATQTGANGWAPTLRANPVPVCP